MDKRKQRGVNVTENIIRVAFGIIQMKTAAQHFETSIASHIAFGSDMGDLGHGRKQFSEIMSCAEVALDEETAKYLYKFAIYKVASSFYATADKATVNRITNQAVLVCCMVNGRRKAIAVSASEVYGVSNEKEETVGGKIEISGAHANQLADLMYGSIKKTYNLSDELLSSSWQGTCCGGQYQAKEFSEQWRRRLKHG